MKKYTVLLFVAVIFFTGCSEDFFDQVIDVEVPEHESALAVTSSMSNTDSILWAYVSNSVGILEQDNPAPITDAVVDVYKNGELFQNLPHAEDGLYGFEIDGPLLNDGAEYELRVASDRFENVSAIQTMPDQIDIISATFEKDGTVDAEGDRVDEFVVEFQDQAGVDNFYIINARFEYTDNNGFSYEQMIYLSSNDPSVQETYEDIYINDILFDGDKHELQFYTYNLYYDEQFMTDAKIILELVHITKDKYFREISLHNYDPENPFAEPTIIHSNIENGYGIFSMQATGPQFIINL